MVACYGPLSIAFFSAYALPLPIHREGQRLKTPVQVPYGTDSIGVPIGDNDPSLSTKKYTESFPLTSY